MQVGAYLHQINKLFKSNDNGNQPSLKNRGSLFATRNTTYKKEEHFKCFQS